MADRDLIVAHPHVHVQLAGLDGNAFMVIGRVTAALKEAGHRVAADRFAHDAMDCVSYEVLDRLITVAWVGKRLEITGGTAVLSVISGTFMVIVLLASAFGGVTP